MSKVKFFTILLLSFVAGVLGGCQRYSEYKTTSQGSVLIVPKNVRIKDVNVIGWKVGKNYKNEISKGINFHVILPSIQKKYIDNLMKMDIDSWIVKVIRKRTTSSETLDYFTIPLRIPQRKIMGTDGYKTMKSGRINIYYASSFVSLDKSTSACPKLGHRKMITKLDIERESSPEQSIHISFVNESALKIQSQYIGYEPEKINGGMSLEGIYVIELSLYSQKKQKLMGNWFRINEKIVISQEKEVALKGCSFYDRIIPL